MVYVDGAANTGRIAIEKIIMVIIAAATTIKPGFALLTVILGTDVGLVVNCVHGGGDDEEGECY